MGNGRSERRTDYLGEEYTQHYDEKGNRIEKTFSRTDLFGETYLEHRDNEGNIIGDSRTYNDMFGDEYLRHRNRSGDFVGTSKNGTDFFGDAITTHLDSNGNVTGKSTPRTDVLGNRYVSHEMKGSAKSPKPSSVASYAESDAVAPGTGLILFFGCVLLAGMIALALIDQSIIEEYLSATTLFAAMGIAILIQLICGLVSVRRNHTSRGGAITVTAFSVALYALLAAEPHLYNSLSPHGFTGLLIFCAQFVPYFIFGVVFGWIAKRNRRNGGEAYITRTYRSLGIVYGIVLFLFQYRDMLINLDGLVSRIVFSILGAFFAAFVCAMLVLLGQGIFSAIKG